MKTNSMTPDEQNAAISAQVDREIPRPAGGFESADSEDDFKARQEARFNELVHNPKLWNFV